MTTHLPPALLSNYMQLNIRSACPSLDIDLTLSALLRRLKLWGSVTTPDPLNEKCYDHPAKCNNRSLYRFCGQPVTVHLINLLTCYMLISHLCLLLEAFCISSCSECFYYSNWIYNRSQSLKYTQCFQYFLVFFFLSKLPFFLCGFLQIIQKVIILQIL